MLRINRDARKFLSVADSLATMVVRSDQASATQRKVLTVAVHLLRYTRDAHGRQGGWDVSEYAEALQHAATALQCIAEEVRTSGVIG
jgi:hypothetical protein